MKFKVHNDDDKTIELDFASLHSELESLKKQQTEELNNNLQLISEKKQLMNELYMYKNSILETEGTIKNLEEKMATIQKENVKLIQQLEEKNKNEELYEFDTNELKLSYEKEKEKLYKEIENYKSQVIDLNEKLQNAEKHQETKNGYLDTIQQTFQRICELVNRIRNKNNDRKSGDYSSLIKDIFSNQNPNSNDDLVASIQQLNDELNENKSIIKAQKSELKTLHEEFEFLKSNSKLKDISLKLYQNGEKPSLQSPSILGIQNQNKSAQSEILVLSKKIELIKEELKQTVADNKQLKKNLFHSRLSLSKNILELEEKKSEIKSIKNIMQSQEREIKALRHTLRNELSISQKLTDELEISSISNIIVGEKIKMKGKTKEKDSKEKDSKEEMILKDKNFKIIIPVTTSSKKKSNKLSLRKKSKSIKKVSFKKDKKKSVN